MEYPDDHPNNSGRPRRQSTAAASKNKTEEKRPKKRKAEVSIEVLYKQENYKEVAPTALETIFESPKTANRKSSGRETRKRESSKGCDNENFGLQRVKRFCQFGCYYYPTKQKENMRKSKAKKIAKKGIKIPQGGVITNEDIQAALANLSDEENDETMNESVLNSTRNTTIDPNDLFDFKTPTKQGYKKHKEEDTSMFYSGNIIKPDETSDALMEDTLKNMMKKMDLDELKDIKLPFADESNDFEIDDVALKIPDFSNTTLGFESKGNKSRRRSGRVTDARNSGIFLPICLEEITDVSELDTKKISENENIQGNDQLLIESDLQNNAFEGRISRRGRVSNSLAKFDTFFEEESPLASDKNKKSRRRSGRVEITKNKNINQICKDEENLIEEDLNIGHNEVKNIKISVKSPGNENLPTNIMIENRSLDVNLNKPENGVRRGRRSNASAQYTAFFEEVSPIASTKKVKKTRCLLNEIKCNEIKVSPKSELHHSPINLMNMVDNEPQDNAKDKIDITLSSDVQESDLVDTKKQTTKKRRGRPAGRGKRRVSGVKRPLYKKIVDSSLSSPNSSVNNSTDTSLQSNTAVGSVEPLLTSPSTLMAELTIKSPSSETSRSTRRSTRRSTSNILLGNMEKIVESETENLFTSKLEVNETNNQNSNLLMVPLRLKRTSSKEVKVNEMNSVNDSSAITSQDSSVFNSSLKEKKSGVQCRTVKRSDGNLFLSQTEEALQIANSISLEEINPENMRKTQSAVLCHSPTNTNIEVCSGKIKKIKLSEVSKDSKVKGVKDKSKCKSSKLTLTVCKSPSDLIDEKVEIDEQFSNEISSPIICGIFNQKTSIRNGKIYSNKDKIEKVN